MCPVLLFLGGWGCLLSGCDTAPSTPQSGPAGREKLSNPSDSVRYAKGFDFVSGDGYRCLRLFDLEKRDGRAICHVCRGAVSKDAFDSPTIRLTDEPVRIATVSTTHLALMSAIGALNTVVGTVYADRILDPDALEIIASGGIVDLTGEHDLDTELTLEAAPSVVTTYPFGGAQYPVLEAAGVGIVPMSEYLETHPLGRAEWMKAAGFIANRMDAADSAFTAVEKRYHELVAMTAALPDDQRPVLFTGSHTNGKWYAPPANSFMGRFSEDAGGRYLFADVVQNGNLSLDFERFMEKAIEADFWGRVVFAPGRLQYSAILEEDERYASLRAFKERNVFYCNVTETDYFGRAITEPDHILADLIAILHPELLPDHRFTYFKPVAE